MRDKEKQKIAQHEHYVNNIGKYRQSTRATRQRRREIVYGIKESSPCTDCGCFYPYYVMDFDHRDSNEKVNNIARMINTAGMDRILEEIKKCDLVCANCHRVRTFNREQELRPIGN